MDGPGHRGVAVVRNEVMVCKYCIIMVYDRELKYVRQSFGSGEGRCHDLSPDIHGNLYVNDCSYSCIQVFSMTVTFYNSLAVMGME